MQTILDDLAAKHQENDQYIKLLRLMKETKKQLLSDNNQLFDVNIELKNTLKGLTYLVFYNLIESTLRESIIRIYDELKENRVCFNTLKADIKKYIISQIKSNMSTDNFVRLMGDISLDICHKSIDSKKIFSGNIDREVINDTAKIYGFSTNSDYEKTRHGEYLEKIKDHRNDLAHGNWSFSEIGRNVTIEELEKMHENLFYYLKSILENIQLYLDNKLYLD